MAVTVYRVWEGTGYKKSSKRVVDPVFTSPNQSRDVNVNVNLIYSGHALSYTSTKLS